MSASRGHDTRGLDIEPSARIDSIRSGIRPIAASPALPAAALAALTLILLLAAAAAPTPALAAEGECPNEARRIEQGTTWLPECRAYEMVTPVVKGSSEPTPVSIAEVGGEAETEPLLPGRLRGTGGARASLDGSRMAWTSDPPPPGARAPGNSNLSTRSANGWASEGLVPPMSPFNDLLCPILMGVSGWSSDLGRSVLDLPAGPPPNNVTGRSFLNTAVNSECGHDEPRLVPGEPEHFRNLFVRDNRAGSHALINLTPSGVVWPEPEEGSQLYWPASFLAASDDLGHVVFEEELALTSDAPIGYPGGDELYEWTGGAVRLVTVLPDGTPVHGSLAGASRNYYSKSGEIGTSHSHIAQFRRAVSADGSRIFFEAPGDEGEGDLYLREGGERTVQVDASQGPGSDGGGDFQAASADGSRAFFTDEERLTADSTAEPGEPDLYEYDVASDELTDLTANAAEPADVLGVSGASEDGTRLYFVAAGALTGEPNSESDTAVPGEPNLYLAHDGAIAFVATLDAAQDECDWVWNANRCPGGDGTGTSGLTSRTSSSGEFLGFNSVRSLTGYDNTIPDSGEPAIEVFLYDAAAAQLRCASCEPGGSPPSAGAAIKPPARPSNFSSWNNAYPPRNVSDRGQVLFETADALLPRDVNGRRDVYEYVDGGLRLLSTGSGEAGSYFLDATPDGSSVFLSTAQRLLPRDTDTVSDYYVARVGGGFAEPPPLPGCEGEGCRGGGTEGSAAYPGTAAFAGRGNLRARRRCTGPARRARRLSRRAKRLRRHSKQAKRNGKSKVANKQKRKATRLAKQARRQSKSAKRCRRAKRRAAR